MRSRPILMTAAVLTALALPVQAVRAQSHDHDAHRPRGAASTDSAFSALQRRGARVMGVDQYTSSHRFESLPDGGRVVLVRDVDDAAGTRAIREHLRTIARQFAAGDFSASATVHARPVPGTEVMRARRDRIRYQFRPLPRGGEVRMTTPDAQALRAIHDFLAFQRADHRTAEKAATPQ